MPKPKIRSRSRVATTPSLPDVQKLSNGHPNVHKKNIKDLIVQVFGYLNSFGPVFIIAPPPPKKTGSFGLYVFRDPVNTRRITNVYVYVYIYICLCFFIYLIIFTYLFICLFICIYCVHAYMYTNVYVYVYVYVCMCMRVCVCVCIYIYIYLSI